jgi:hypothetical protein
MSSVIGERRARETEKSLLELAGLEPLAFFTVEQPLLTRLLVLVEGFICKT